MPTVKKISLVLVLAAQLGGCALFGGGEPSPQQTEGPVADAAPVAGAAPVASSAETRSVQELWSKSRCSNPQEAEARLNKILLEQEGDALALGLRGLARSEMRKHEEAFEDLTKAVRLSPTADMYAWRGLALHRSGKARGAELDARYALRMNAQQPLAHMVLGLALQAQDKTSEACPPLIQACQGGECLGLEEAKAAGICR